MKVPFVKMHGNGNDFVIVDNTKLQIEYNKKIIERLSNRKTGIGCDQFIFLENSKDFDIFMKIFNANGEEAEMCGNAARCVASLIIAGNNKKIVKIETISITLIGQLEKDNKISISLNIPEQNLDKIIDKKHVKENKINFSFVSPLLKEGIVVNMGNPHVVFFIEDLSNIELEKLGPAIEKNSIFKNGANVEFVEVKSNDVIKIKFWERGAGITLSCGSGILAAFYAGHTEKKCSSSVKVLLPIGSVDVNIKNKAITLSGVPEVSFLGEFSYE
jgi:diaminopimelate epimerase